MQYSSASFQDNVMFCNKYSLGWINAKFGSVKNDEMYHKQEVLNLLVTEYKIILPKS
jgi:hypothetical protein